jgi:hypothetical protein
MSGENVALIRSLYEAFRRRDLPAIAARIHPSIVVVQTELLPWGGRYEGLDGFRTFFGKLTQAITSEVEAELLLEAGDRVVAIGRTHGHVNGSQTPFDLTAVHVWTIRDGKVAGFEPYIDTPAMLKVLGAS